MFPGWGREVVGFLFDCIVWQGGLPIHSLGQILCTYRSTQEVMMRIEDKTFEDQPVRLDGNEYIKCVFRRCELQFGGTGAVSMVECAFDRCSWSFTGPAALTVQFMMALYHGAGEGGRDLIERTFEDIRRGRQPQGG